MLRRRGDLIPITPSQVWLAGFSFGSDDVPPNEEEYSKAKFDTGITILTQKAETFVLLEIVGRSYLQDP